MRSPLLLALPIAVTLALAASGAPHAQTQRSGGGDSQRLAQQLQQIASERSAAQAEAVKAKEAAADLTRKLAQMTAERDALKGRLAAGSAADAREKSVTQELESTKARMAELVTKFRETASTLREVEGGRSQTRTELGALQRDYRACVEHNTELAGVALEAIDRYESTGRAARALRSEPFTGIARARAQNLADEYHARVEDLRQRDAQRAAPPADPGTTTDSTAPR
jgi:chromosome segregation ATPase